MELNLERDNLEVGGGAMSRGRAPRSFILVLSQKVRNLVECWALKLITC